MADEAKVTPEELTVDQLKEQLAQAKAENAKLGAEAAKQKNRQKMRILKKMQTSPLITAKPRVLRVMDLKTTRKK